MVEVCNRPAFGGGYCELEKGHDGKHFRAWPDRPGGFTWSDESTDEQVRKHTTGRD